VKRDIVDAAAGQPQAANLFTTSRVQNITPDAGRSARNVVTTIHAIRLPARRPKLQNPIRSAFTIFRKLATISAPLSLD
jgi:hypothetical protein